MESTLRRLRGALSATLAYLWSGWGAMASLLLFCALWEWGARIYGPLVLPGPMATFERLEAMFRTGMALPELAISARRTLYGLGLALAAGSSLGVLAGRSLTAAMISRPLVTLLLGMPPIAWLVLAMLWFGMGDATPVFTVFVACFPIVFAAAMQGARTLDNHLKDVACVYRLPWHMMLTDLYLPHVASYLFPAWITALGTSWKVVVMAELLTTVDGVGAALAVSRAQLDTATSLGWIVAVLGLLLAVEYLFLEPLKRTVERWRAASA
ncbi:ABC transporter permease [Pollutimonas bauzanensis]|uniref:NitT/TauT family transport system permease protein n=1 Tax=Pollutimonas bauzanensis TaxID=658167 RepID=A0A1M5NVM7_9BURK|nr:ABC transporter permease subunit [Pollutimonas bauzanensis]SHG93547.1 NitT/TauT family transport system permease protein [Pollutimonas bauzanensis]